jgi:hypothetical protein
MAYSTDQLADLLFKKVLAGKATTDTNKAFFEEAINSRKAILSDDIWNQSGLIPTTAPVLAPDGISGVVQYKQNVALVPIPGTNSFTTGITDIIPFNFGDGSYNYILRDGNSDPIAPGTADWLLDPESGVVTFFDGGATFSTIIATGTLTLTVYRYVGTKGVSGGTVGGGTIAGWLAPVITRMDNVTFEALVGPSNGDRYLLTSDTGDVITIHDPDTGIATPNQIVPEDSVVEWFDDAANAGADAGWIIDFDGSAPSNGTSLTVLDEPGFMYQYYSAAWNSLSFESTYPGREYKSLTADATSVDGDEITASALPGGLTTTPTPDTYVAILLNGVQVSIQDSNTVLASITAHCYFSDDGGLNSKSLDALDPGDRLYWVGSNAGYELSATDRIDINFVKK